MTKHTKIVKTFTQVQGLINTNCQPTLSHRNSLRHTVYCFYIHFILHNAPLTIQKPAELLGHNKEKKTG